MHYRIFENRYSKPAIFFHWATFLLVALAWLAIEIRGPKGSDSRALWTAVVIGTDALLRPVIKTAHEWLGNAFDFVVGLHALGALSHHVIFGNRTLRRML